MRELSVAEQRYRAVLAVISDGRTVKEVAAAVGVSRQTVHAWLVKYEAGGLEGLVDGSHRPVGCPHQMPAVVEAVLEVRRKHPGWGPRRIAIEVGRADPDLVVTESSVYRCLRRAGLVEPDGRRRRRRDWRRWERGRPNELWQMDTVGGFLLSDGTHAKALTGVDDHSRFCVSARLMLRERTQPVCAGLTLALRSFGVPEQILTDNGLAGMTGALHADPTAAGVVAAAGVIVLAMGAYDVRLIDGTLCRSPDLSVQATSSKPGSRCNRRGVSEVRRRLNGLSAEITRLRQGRPVVIRLVTPPPASTAAGLSGPNRHRNDRGARNALERLAAIECEEIARTGGSCVDLGQVLDAEAILNDPHSFGQLLSARAHEVVALELLAQGLA